MNEQEMKQTLIGTWVSSNPCAKKPLPKETMVFTANTCTSTNENNVSHTFPYTASGDKNVLVLDLSQGKKVNLGFIDAKNFQRAKTIVRDGKQINLTYQFTKQ